MTVHFGAAAQPRFQLAQLTRGKVESQRRDHEHDYRRDERDELREHAKPASMLVAERLDVRVTVPFGQPPWVRHAWVRTARSTWGLSVGPGVSTTKPEEPSF